MSDQFPTIIQKVMHEPIRFQHREWLIGWLQGRLGAARKLAVAQLNAGAWGEKDIAQVCGLPLAEVQALRDKPDISGELSEQAADRLEKWAERIWREGERHLLRKILVDRFGCLSEWAIRKLDIAIDLQISQWLYEMPFAETVEDLLEDEGEYAPTRKTLIEQWTDSGIKQGVRLSLRRQISVKFGEIPDWAAQRLNRAELDQLYCWVEQILAVDSLESLFNSANTLDEVFKR